MLLAGVLVFAELAGTVDVVNRTEVRVRHADGVSPDPSSDLVDAPSVRFGLGDRQWTSSLGYAALFTLPDVQQTISPQLFQFADVGTSWHNRHVRIGLAEYVSYGEQNAGVLLTAPQPGAPGAPTTTPTGGPAAPTPAAPAPQLLAPPAVLRMGSSRTALTSQLDLSRQWNAGMTVDYTISGGTDKASQASMPLVQGPRAEGLVSYAATRIDTLDTRVTAQHASAAEGPCNPAINVPLPAGTPPPGPGGPPAPTCSPTAEMLQLMETWHHQLTHTSQASIGAGASYLHARLNPDQPYVNRLYPVAAAGFLHEREVADIRTTLRVDAMVYPVLDARSGIMEERATGTVTLTFPIRSVTLIGGVGASHSIVSPFLRPSRLVQGFFEVDYRVTRYMDVGGGARYAWQEALPLPPFAAGFAYAQITLHAPQVKF